MTENAPDQVPQPQPAPQPVQAPPIPQPQPQQAPQYAAPEANPALIPPAPGQIPPQAPHQGSLVNPVPGAPLTDLTGGMKLGYFGLGFLLGPAGILVAWLINVSAYQAVKSGAIKFSLIGCIVAIVIAILLSALMMFGMFAAMESLYYY